MDFITGTIGQGGAIEGTAKGLVPDVERNLGQELPITVPNSVNKYTVRTREHMYKLMEVAKGVVKYMDDMGITHSDGSEVSAIASQIWHGSRKGK